MNIKRAKEEIKDTIEAYLLKDEYGEYVIPQMRQLPVLLLGAPGIGKTQIMEQIARECGIGLVSYTITHHTHAGNQHRGYSPDSRTFPTAASYRLLWSLPSRG